MPLITTFSGNDDEAFPLWVPDPDIDALLGGGDINAALTELYNYISQQCSWGAKMEEFTESQKNLYCNRSLEREVRKGGFKQYFNNASGNLALETIESLKAIGADNTAAILHQAMNEFANGKVTKDRVQRQEQIVQLGETATNNWAALNGHFTNSGDDLDQLNFEYFRQNKEAFRPGK